MGSILLRADEHRTDIGIQDTIIKGCNRNSRITENMRYSLFFQTLYDRICSKHSTSLSILFVEILYIISLKIQQHKKKQ